MYGLEVEGIVSECVSQALCDVCAVGDSAPLSLTEVAEFGLVAPSSSAEPMRSTLGWPSGSNFYRRRYLLTGQGVTPYHLTASADRRTPCWVPSHSAEEGQVPESTDLGSPSD